MTWRFIYLGERHPYEVSSYSEAFKKARAANLVPDTMYIFQYGEPTVHYGTSPNTFRIKRKFCEENKIFLARANHGSIPTYWDKASLYVFIVYRLSEEPVHSEELLRCQRGIVNALAELGLKAKIKEGWNDVLLNGKKVASIGSKLFYKGVQVSRFAIFLDFDFDTAEKAVIPKQEMRGYMTSLNAELGREVSPQEVVDALKVGFGSILDVAFQVEYELTEGERDLVDGLREKYSSEKWIKTGRWSPVKEYER